MVIILAAGIVVAFLVVTLEQTLLGTLIGWIGAIGWSALVLIMALVASLAVSWGLAALLGPS